MRIKKTSQYIEGGTGLPSYFTNEIDTGMKWIDGKTIYRKVIETTTALSAGSTTISHGITNFGQVTNWRLTNDRNQTFPRVETDTTNNNWTGISGVDNTNVYIRVIGTTWTSRKWIIIIEYTKTTD